MPVAVEWSIIVNVLFVAGIYEEGVEGFFKGLGKGLLGLITKPTGGAVDMLSTAFDGIRRYSQRMYYCSLYSFKENVYFRMASRLGFIIAAHFSAMYNCDLKNSLSHIFVEPLKWEMMWW